MSTRMMSNKHLCDAGFTFVDGVTGLTGLRRFSWEKLIFETL